MLLQQHLPFTVLKLQGLLEASSYADLLQQHLPFTVLKLFASPLRQYQNYKRVATALTVHGIETRYG